MSLPALRSIFVCRHAVVNPQVARRLLHARRTVYLNRFPISICGGLLGQK
jgi:hypothetical protein